MVRDKFKKKDHDEEDDFYFKPLSHTQLQELHIEVQRAGGWDRFLRSIPAEIKEADGSTRKVHIVRLDENGKVCSVFQIPVIGQRIYPNWDIFYSTDIPRDTWQKIRKDYEKYVFGLEQQKYRSNPDLKTQQIEKSKKLLQETLDIKNDSDNY